MSDAGRIALSAFQSTEAPVAVADVDARGGRGGNPYEDAKDVDKDEDGDDKVKGNDADFVAVTVVLLITSACAELSCTLSALSCACNASI